MNEHQMEGDHGLITLVNAWATLALVSGMLELLSANSATNLEDKSSLVEHRRSRYYPLRFDDAELALRSVSKARLSESMEVSQKMVIEGVLSIQAGDNPRILAQKMLTYLTPKDRKAIESDVMKIKETVMAKKKREAQAAVPVGLIPTPIWLPS